MFLAVQCRLSLCIATLVLSATASLVAQTSQDEVAFEVEGRVAAVFEGAEEDLVQILVQSAQVRRFEQLTAQLRFPGPGEFVYVHVARTGRRIALPKAGTTVQASLTSGSRRQWEGRGDGWLRSAGNPATSAGGREGEIAALGIRAERVVLPSGAGLRAIRVDPGSPAATAGIEKGDVLVKADGFELTKPEQLQAVASRARGELTVTVRDVRTGREIPVKVAMNNLAGRRAPGRQAPAARKIGVTTELAFFGGEAAVKVKEVQPNSPASEAGVLPGWLILEVDGKRLLHPKEFQQATRARKQTWKVVDPRNRNEKLIKIQL